MIIFLSMLSLGCLLFALIAGDGDSIYSGVKNLWRAELEMVK